MYKEKPTIYVIGIGMGTQETLTEEGNYRIRHCDCLIGASRMVELATGEQDTFVSYQPEEIKTYLEQHTSYKQVVIALSGDVGFYSGAKKLLVELKEYPVTVLPGISSVVYLAAKLQTPWEDGALVSIHGKCHNLIHTVVHHAKTFVLLGDKSQGLELCKKLKYYAIKGLTIYIGSNLSYPNECIKVCSIEELQPEDLQDLSVAMIINEHPVTKVARHISDEEFIRGSVPMTKEEIRTVSLSKLGLEQSAIVYDIGAGTGSVAIEAAMQDGSIQVFAIEKNPKGVQLIQENKQKFCVDNVEIIEGIAPEILEELPPPTHVFIGGSAGNLKEIITVVKAKNRHARIVMNAISLETITEVMQCIKEGLLLQPDIVQMSISKSKELGEYHMMMGLNPIYVITCE
ncbi:precorrin-6Y C5,15-methyltransferase (decarboxylating) subunit CbiT [Lachnospiraceae bacterium LCP25S3_G4]